MKKNPNNRQSLKSQPPSVVLVTGATSGIGNAIANHLHQKGYTVYGAGRRVQPHSGYPFHALKMDVNVDESVNRAIQVILQQEQRIDAVINNAGIALTGAVEDTSLSKARAQLNTNFFSTHRICRAVLPVMRQQRSGMIINISSIGGLIAIPFQAFYSASKFALEGYTEALRMEVDPWNIRVILVEPGNFNTPITKNRQQATDSARSPYRNWFYRAHEIISRDEQNGPSPQRVATLIERILKKKNPKLRYICGPLLDKSAPFCRKWLPQSWFEFFVKKYFGIDFKKNF